MSRFSRSAPKTSPVHGRKQRLCASTMLAGLLSLACAGGAQALPVDGQVAAGGASIAQGGGGLTVSQSTQNAAINWQSFSIGQGEAVTFVQPNSQSVALNRVVGADPSSILGSLSANGKVFLVNPNGILFGQGAQVNVAGLVASTLNITDSDFMAGCYSFAGTSGGTVSNLGSINADGGYVALLGAKVSNDGVISARMGSVALAAGEGVTLDVAGDGMLSVAVDKGAVDALVANGGLIRADGGQVMLTARAAGQLLRTVVNNTGVIEARTLQSHNGSISLMGDADSGVVNVSGTLDATAPNGGNGGSIETSAATVNVDNAAVITTAAPMGVTGTWLIDPVDFIVGPGGNISGATLSAQLVTNSVVISTIATGPDATVAGTPPVTTLHSTTPGNGDIIVNDAIAWTATPSATTLTLNAARDVTLNAPITATNGNLVVCCSRDIGVHGAITTVGGSVLLSAGQNLVVAAAMTTTDGNITLCAAQNVTVSGALTLTRGSSIPAQSLGLALGLFIIAGNGGTGAGTLIIPPGTPTMTVTGPNAPVLIEYNPTSYATPTDYAPKFTLTLGATETQKMLVFPTVTKVFDGSTATTLVSLQGAPANVALGGSGTATFDSAAVGNNIGITYTGYSLTGSNAAAFALGQGCCTTTFRTTGNIIAAVVIPPTPLVPVKAGLTTPS